MDGFTDRSLYNNGTSRALFLLSNKQRKENWRHKLNSEETQPMKSNQTNQSTDHIIFENEIDASILEINVITIEFVVQ